jgi:hypothetical protein
MNDNNESKNLLAGGRILNFLNNGRACHYSDNSLLDVKYFFPVNCVFPNIYSI